MSRTAPPRTPAAPPASAKEGAAHVRKFMVELFDRKDGRAVDWKMIAGTLFLAGFDVLDELPADQKAALIWRVHERSYVPATGDDGSAGMKALEQAAAALADPGPLHVVKPRPPT